MNQNPHQQFQKRVQQQQQQQQRAAGAYVWQQKRKKLQQKPRIQLNSQSLQQKEEAPVIRPIAQERSSVARGASSAGTFIGSFLVLGVLFVIGGAGVGLVLGGDELASVGAVIGIIVAYVIARARTS